MKKTIAILGLLTSSLTVSAATIEQAINKLEGRETSVIVAADNRSVEQLLVDAKHLSEGAADLTMQAMDLKSGQRPDGSTVGPSSRARLLNRALDKVDESIADTKKAAIRARLSNSTTGQGDYFLEQSAVSATKMYSEFRKALQAKFNQELN